MQLSKPVASFLAILLAGLGYIGLSHLLAHHDKPCSEGRAICSGQGNKQKGLTIAAYYPRSYSDPQTNNELLALKKTGASWVAIEVSGTQASIQSPAVSNAQSPKPADLERFTKNAHELGLKVAWLFDVQITKDPSHGRDQIGEGMNADTAVAWLSSYRQFVTSYARLAQSAKVEEISIGSNVKELQIYSDQWRKLISQMRSSYHGALLYTATPEEAITVGFWNYLDYVGIRAFFPLSAANQKPTASVLDASWKTRLSMLERVSRITKKKIIFSEIGYPALPTAAAKPYVFDPATPDYQTQNALYQAFFRDAWPKSWVEGVFFWRFALGDDPSGYSPAGDPAGDTLIKAYK